MLIRFPDTGEAVAVVADATGAARHVTVMIGPPHIDHPIEAAIDAIIAANMDKVEEYRGGKDKLFGFFVGQTMKAMQGKANPAVVNRILKDKLDG